MMALGKSYPYFPTIPGMAVPESLDTVDPNLQVPYTQQYTGGVDHQFGSGLVVSASVVHSRGSGLEYISQNYTLNPDGSVSIVDKRFANINELQNVGFVHYTALQTQARYRKGRLDPDRLLHLVEGLLEPDESGHHRLDADQPVRPRPGPGPRRFGPAPQLRLQRLRTTSRSTSRWPASAPTGRPGRGASPRTRTPTGAVFPPRPEPKNSRRGDEFSTVDLRVSKVFGLGKQVRCTFFWEGYNLFNTLNYTAYNGLKESPTFGLPSAAAERRRQQVGLRIDF